MTPLILPLGDRGLLVRFDTTLSDNGNRAAIAFARRLRADMPPGVREIDPNLVSVLLRYDPDTISFGRLAGEVRMLLSAPRLEESEAKAARHIIPVTFDGPDLEEVAAGLELTPPAFIAAHNAAPLRSLTTGFAPGFVYCGFHPDSLRLPRRKAVRPTVPAGTILFAAGQTALTSTPLPTGWHVIGSTTFRNFDPKSDPPTRIREGDRIVFEVAS